MDWTATTLTRLRLISIDAAKHTRDFIRREVWLNPESAELFTAGQGKEILNPCRNLDIAAERLLLSRLRETLGWEFGHFGEEGGLNFSGNENLFALIDAVDGSDLVLRGRELFGAVSLAWFNPQSNQLLSAVVADLVGYSNLVWSWQKEAGSFWENDFFPKPQPLVTPTEVRDDPFFATVSIKPVVELKYQSGYNRVLEWLAEQYPRARFSKAHCGSPGTCRAAQGTIDALVYLVGGQSHDVYGPAAILKGASGKIISLKTGEELKLEIDFCGNLEEQFDQRHPFVCGNPNWVDRIIRLLEDL